MTYETCCAFCCLDISQTESSFPELNFIGDLRTELSSFFKKLTDFLVALVTCRLNLNVLITKLPWLLID